MDAAGRPLRNDMAGNRRLLFVVVTVSTTTALTIGGAELLFYLLDNPSSAPIARAPRSAGAGDQRHDDHHFEAVPVYRETPGGMRLRPSLDVEIVNPLTGATTAFRTNALGHRGPDVEPQRPGERRILVLGDSISCAVFTPEEQTYPGVLAELTGATVYNASVTGLGLREELLVLHESGLQAEPDVVIVGMYLNDAHASRFRRIPEGLLARSAIARRLRNAKSRFGAAESVERRYERLSGKPFPSGAFDPGAWRTNRTAFEAQMGASLDDWGYGFFEAAWEDMRPDLEILRDLASRHTFELVVALFPVRYQVEAEYLDERPQRLFRSLMSELDIRHIDLLPAFRAAYRSQGKSLTHDHCHLTLEGHRLVAETLHGFLGRT